MSCVISNVFVEELDHKIFIQFLKSRNCAAFRKSNFVESYFLTRRSVNRPSKLQMNGKKVDTFGDKYYRFGLIQEQLREPNVRMYGVSI